MQNVTKYEGSLYKLSSTDAKEWQKAAGKRTTSSEETAADESAETQDTVAANVEDTAAYGVEVSEEGLTRQTAADEEQRRAKLRKNYLSPEERKSLMESAQSQIEGAKMMFESLRGDYLGVSGVKVKTDGNSEEKAEKDKAPQEQLEDKIAELQKKIAELQAKPTYTSEEAAAKEEQIKMLSTQLQLLMAQLVKMMKEMEKAGK